MPALPFIIAALCTLAIAYRYYSAFIPAKVLSLDDSMVTPAHRLADGHNYIPTNRWVLFGHHFAAISGAGPLIGPVLAAQFGFLPGYLWILIGVVCLLGCVFLGRKVAQSPYASLFDLSRETLIISIAGYGFIASVLPVWVLLCPRDYLSSFMKLGTIALLTGAVIFVNPTLHMPMFSRFVGGGGPIVPGKVFPFVFITIVCGSISGFHAIISSGTTPKMISNERDCHAIGYGAMLCEAWVGLTSLFAAAALFPEDYFAINVMPEKFSQLGMAVHNLPVLGSHAS